VTDGQEGPGDALETWLRETAAWVEAELRAQLSEPDGAGGTSLAEAMAYAVLGGGKRLRPAIVRLCCTALGGRDEDCAPAAAALELVHAYSLVHDDLPCMDDDDLRRGRPTCHKVFGEAMAVLAGDALQAKAFELLARGQGERAREWTRVLARAAGVDGMVGGQALDMTLPGQSPRVDEVQAMHALKTGALFAAAAEMGAIAALADGDRREAARRFGAALGGLFQAVDDVLDVTGDAQTLGKTPGKDARHEKATLVAALGLEGARGEVERLEARARQAALDLGLAGEHLGPRLIERLARRRK